ncbi:MAG TPA: hypothetical protein VEJ41_05620 [Candidatus Acidoferrales bacterium]|nr:hypothetical protein [Candidatus Acidoferrales bacterium]
MLRPDETTIARVIASPPFAQATADALRRAAGDALLGCVSDNDVNATFLSLKTGDAGLGERLKRVADAIGAPAAQERSLRLELQPLDPASLREDALRAIAVELHGILQAPIYIGRRSKPVSAWAYDRPMGWGPAGLSAQSAAAVLPFGGSQSGGVAIEVGARTLIAKAKVVGATLEPSALANIAAATGSGSSGFVDAAVYPLGTRKDGASVFVLELGDPKRTPLHRVLATIEIEAQRYGARLGLGALLSDAPLEVFLGALATHMGLGVTPAQVIETHVAQHAASQ